MTADSIDFLGPLGFDGARLEAEHGPADWERLGDLTRACDLWGMSALMRVRTLEPSLIGRALTLGMHGIVIPQLNDADEARALVKATKFAPVAPGTFCRGDAAARLIELGTRFLYVSYDQWLTEAAGAWVRHVRPRVD